MNVEDILRLIIIFSISIAILSLVFNMLKIAKNETERYGEESTIKNACQFLGINIETGKNNNINELSINNAKEVEKLFRKVKCYKISEYLAKKIDSCIKEGKNCNKCTNSIDLCLSLMDLSRVIDSCKKISSLYSICLEKKGKAKLMKCILDHKEEWCK